MTDAVSSVTSAATTGGSSTTGISDAALADYDDFLTLLTAQLNNQDPLNPQDSTEFVEQIATFTTVEQQINSNEKLDELIAISTEQSVSDLASWVGMEVSAPGLAYAFDGDQLAVDPVVDAAAQSAQMLIKDSDERTIATISYNPADPTSLTWDGTQDDGSKAGEGSYFIDFELTFVDDAGEETVQAFTSADYAKVVEARIVDGAQALILDNGFVIDAESVNAVRDPNASNTDAANVAAAVTDAVDDLLT